MGVVVQFFLAGLAAFGATTFDPHRAVVNALVVFYVAHEVLQRSRSYLASKIAA